MNNMEKKIFNRDELWIKTEWDCDGVAVSSCESWCLHWDSETFPSVARQLSVAARPGQDVELQSWEISRFLAPVSCNFSVYFQKI